MAKKKCENCKTRPLVKRSRMGPWPKYCRQCAPLIKKENERLWRKNHPRVVYERKRRWRLDNPEKSRNAERRWRAANPEKTRAIYLRKKEKNPDYKKRWMATLQEKARLWDAFIETTGAKL